MLIAGPPGTGKSAIAAAVLGRIVDGRSGAPSLFSKQLSESTVQTDLIGPIDFKVLTETGRTQYLTEHGMLGATYAFLDEVFDGRDMLLRSILGVLHERELRHGRSVTAGICETTVMTSNRYLSEVLARAPEVLLAFADRISFIAFLPKGFARPVSRSTMLSRAVEAQRPELRARLTIQDVDLLQNAVQRVKMPAAVTEGLELVATQLEQELAAHVVRAADYVPTKYFSQRSLVKALWAIKAAVVRDKIYVHPDRPLEATEADLDDLRYFFLLGGPPPSETELLLQSAVDPRERAQLEIIRLEQRAFDEALTRAKAELPQGVDREAATLNVPEEIAAAEGLLRAFQLPRALGVARSLRAKLIPGPRYEQNRRPLASAARTLLMAVEQAVSARNRAGDEGGVVALAGLLTEVLSVAREVPELRPHAPRLEEALARHCELQLAAQADLARGADFDALTSLDEVERRGQSAKETLAALGGLRDALSSLSIERRDAVHRLEGLARGEVAASVRRQALRAFLPARPTTAFDNLSAESRRLSRLEELLTAIDPAAGSLRAELLAPLASAFTRGTIARATAQRVDQLARVVQVVGEALRREGFEPELLLREHAEILLEKLGAIHGPILPSAPRVTAEVASTGGAYRFYRELANAGADGEWQSLEALERVLSGAGEALRVPAEVRAAIVERERSFLAARVEFLVEWLEAVRGVVPAERAAADPAEAEQAFELLVRSRLPLLLTREGELVRLRASIEALAAADTTPGGGGPPLLERVDRLAMEFGEYARVVLQRVSRG